MTNLVRFGSSFENILWTKEAGLIVRPDCFADPNSEFKADGIKKTGNGLYITQIIQNLLPETIYTMSLYIWATPTNSPTIKFFYDLNNGSGRVLTNDISNYHATGEWRRRTFTFTTSAVIGETGHTAGFQLNRSASEVNEYYFYGFQLVEGSVALPYVDIPDLLEIGYIPNDTIFTIASSNIINSIYHEINDSVDLYIKDYNLFSYPNSFGAANWLKLSVSVIESNVSASPDALDVFDIDRLEAKISVSNYIFQRLLSYSFSPNNIYTLSYYIRRISGGSGSSRSRLWSTDHGEIVTSYSTIRDYWELKTWTFTLPSTFTGAFLECGINITTSGINMIFEIADAQIVNNTIRIPFVRSASVFPELYLNPVPIAYSDIDIYSNIPLPEIIGSIGGMVKIEGNAIPWGNAIGQIYPDAPHDYVYNISGIDDQVQCFGVEDPFGGWDAAKIIIKNRDTSRGINGIINHSLYPNTPYTFSFYLKNLHSENVTFQYSIFSQSLNSISIIDHDFRNANVMYGSLVSPVIYGEDLNPVETTPDSGTNYIKNNVFIRRFDVEPDETHERAFVYIELDNGYDINKTYNVRCWAKSWETDSDRSVKSVFLGAIYKLLDGKIVERFSELTAVPLRTDWYMPGYNNIRFPSDIDPTFNPRVGIYIYGKVDLADLTLTSNDAFQSDYISAPAVGNWTRHSITFYPTTPFFNVGTVKYEPWRSNPVTISLKYPTFHIGINAPSDSSVSATIGLTGLQLVEGLIPKPYEITNLEYVTAFYSIPNTISLKPNIHNLEYSSGDLILNPGSIKNSNQIPDTRIGLNLAKYDHEPIFLNLWDGGSRIGIRRRGVFGIVQNDGPPNFGYSIDIQNRYIVSLNNNWDNTWVKLDLDSYGNIKKIPSYADLVDFGYDGDPNPSVNIYAMIGRSTPLSWFFFEYRPPYHNSGIYVLKWDGDGDIDIQNNNGLAPGPYPGVIISSQPNRLEIQYDCSIRYDNGTTDSRIRTGFYFRISRINSEDYPRNFVFCEKRYENIINNGEICYPFYLDQLIPASVCRTMHFANTNEDPEWEWDHDRHTKFWKKQISMANLSHRHWWCNIPSLADDNYIRQLAILTRDYLNPELKVFIEYTNEYWNGNMLGSRVSNARADYYNFIDEFPDAINPSWEASQKAFAYRSTDIFNIWDEVFSGVAKLLQPVKLYDDPVLQTKRLVRVMGGLRSNISNIEAVWNHASDNSYDPELPWDMYAASGYYANSLHKEQKLPTNITDVVNYAQNELSTIYLNENAPQKNAAEFTWNLSPTEKEQVHFGVYEGGPHVIGQASVAAAGSEFWNFLKMIWGFHLDSEQSYIQLKTYFDWWNSITKDKSNSVFCFFESANIQTSFMTFGLSRHLISRPISQHLASPKTRAFYDQANASNFHTVITITPDWNPKKYNVYLNNSTTYILLTSNIELNFIFISDKSRELIIYFIQDDIGGREIYFDQDIKFSNSGKSSIDIDPKYVTKATFRNFKDNVFCKMYSVIGSFNKTPHWNYPDQVFWNDISNQYIIEKKNLISSLRDLKKWSNTDTVNGMNYSGAVLGSNDRVYGIPFNNNAFIEIDYNQHRVFQKSAFGANLSLNSQSYYGGCLGQDNNIYCAPYNAQYILRLNLEDTPVAEELTNNPPLIGNNKYRGCISTTVNNKILFVPYDAETVLIYDIETDTFESTNFGLLLTGINKWFGAIEGPDNKVYCIPHNHTQVLVIDYVNMTAELTNFGLDLSGLGKWAGSVINPINGMIYCVPYNSSNILRINALNNTASLTRFGLAESDFISAEKWIGGFVAPDNRIYFMFFQNNLFLEIDCNSEVARLTTGSFQGWYTGDPFNQKNVGAVLAPNGKSYLVPYNAGEVKEFEFIPNSLSKSLCINPRFNKSF